MRKIEKIIQKFEVSTNAEKDKTILEKVLRAQKEFKERKSASTRPNIWRIIMESKIIKIAAAVVVIVAAGLIIHFSGGSVDLATIAFADISEAMKNVPWMHVKSRGFDQKRKGVVEMWIGFDAKINAAKEPDGTTIFWNINEHKSYKYDPQNNNITIEHAYENSVPIPMSSPVLFLESMQKTFKEAGAQILTNSGEYKGMKAQVQKISLPSMDPNSGENTICLYIDTKSNLLFAAQVKSTDSNGNTLVEGETTFDYPQTGPADIYALGVPQDAQIIDKLPQKDFQAIWDHYRQKREEVTKEYIAVITQTNSSFGNVITTIDVDYKSNKNHRLEHHSVFNQNTLGQYEKFWPQYKEQLGDSFESLLMWTQAHYKSTGNVSVYLHDGQYDFSTRRDDNGSWTKLTKYDSPNFKHMPRVYLECLGWPTIGKTGHIIEDDYAKENNLICIERLQQGSVLSGIVSQPARFLYYIDPQKDYICRREVTERCPGAEWQEDKNWLEGIEPEKIRDGSIVVEEITDVIQAPNGYWYPKTIEVKQTSIRKDYKEVPLRITSIKRVYIQTNPEFPNGIFDINTLPGQ